MVYLEKSALEKHDIFLIYERMHRNEQISTD